MIKRSNTRFGAKNYAFEDSGDVNPMETVANLSDVMLVFAVALMLAIVAHWNVDITKSNLETFDEEEMQAIDESQTEEITSESSGYESMGRAYKDPKTGEVYVIQDAESKASGSSSATGSNTSSASGSSSATSTTTN